MGESLRCAEVQPLLQRRCGDRGDTVHAAFVNGRRLAEGDEGLWLARNAARRAVAAPLAGTPAWGQVERLTGWFQPTPQLEELVDASRSARCLALVGVAGAGKSTLAAALARAELADDLVPARFVHGLVFAAPATSAADLGGELHRQLVVTVPGFAAAAEAFQRGTPEQVWRQLDVSIVWWSGRWGWSRLSGRADRGGRDRPAAGGGGAGGAGCPWGAGGRPGVSRSGWW